MSAMEQMAKNILLSILPSEVMALVTKENMDAVTAKAKDFVETQAAIRTEQLEQRKMLEELLNDRRNSNSGGRKRGPSTSGPATGDGDAASN